MQKFSDIFTIARDLIHKKQYHDAESLLVEALESEPQNSLLWGLLAESYLKSGKSEKAEEANNKALAINPSNRFALQRKGDILAGKKKYEEALAVFKYLHDAGEEDPYLYRRIAKVHALQKDNKKAISVIVSAIEKFPLRADLYYQAFLLYRDEGMHDEAMKAISEAVQLEPHNQLYRSAKLSLRAECENVEKLEEAVELAGDSDASMLRILARKLKKEGKNEKAIEIFKKIISIEDSEFSRKELAFAYYHNKDFAKAFYLFMTLSDDAFSEIPFVNSIVASAKMREEKEALLERMTRLAASGNKALWVKVNRIKKELTDAKSDGND